MTLAARISGNSGGRQRRQKQRQWQGHTTINQQKAATATKTAFVAAFVATAAAVAAAVATVTIASEILVPGSNPENL